MLPPNPPSMAYRDFDPSIEQFEENEEIDDEESSTVEISSVEVNILIYLYLLESNFPHAAFTLLNESNLTQTSLFQYFNPLYTSSKKSNGTPGVGKSPRDGLFGKPEGRIPRGELIRKLWKGLRWEEVERHVHAGGRFKPSCPNPFHLIVPHICPPGYPSSATNPTPLPPSVMDSPPPPRRPEPFPAPREREPIAGPSRNKDLTETKGKRKSRRMSNDSSSRNPSPVRSASPAKDKRKDKDKKRSKFADDDRPPSRRKDKDRADDAMSIDEEPRKKPRLSNGRATSPSRKEKDGTPNSRLGVSTGNGDRRSKSPMNVKTKQEKVDKRSREEESKDDEEDDEELQEKEKEEDEKRQRDEERRKRPGWIDDKDVAFFREHRDCVSTVAWNPKNKDVLATGSGDGTARLWDFHSPTKGDSKTLEMGKKPYVISHKSIESNKKAVTALAWHPDGTVLATGSYDGTGRLFTPSGQLQGIMTYGRGSIRAIKFSPSGSFILTAKTDYTVSLWAVGLANDQRMIRTFQPHTAEVNDVEWLDDQVFASCGNDKKIFVYRANDPRSRYTFNGHTDDITRIKWSPKKAGQPVEKRMLASASDDGTVRIWVMPDYPRDMGSASRSASPLKARLEDEEGLDLGKNKALNVLEVVKESENKRMDMVEWAPDGEIIAAGGQDTTVKLFNAVSGELLHVLKGLEEGTGSFAFSLATKGLIAGGGWNGHLLIWDVESGDVKGEYEFDEDPGKQSRRDQPMNLSIKWREDGEHLAIGLADRQVMMVYTGGLGKKD